MAIDGLYYIVTPSGAPATRHDTKAGAAQAAKAALDHGNRAVAITDGKGRRCELYRPAKGDWSIRRVKA